MAAGNGKEGALTLMCKPRKGCLSSFTDFVHLEADLEFSLGNGHQPFGAANLRFSVKGFRISQTGAPTPMVGRKPIIWPNFSRKLHEN